MTISNKYFIFDFDDTLWGRNSNLLDISIENLFLLQKLSKMYNVIIISGNSIDHIKECYLKAGIIPNYDIWANASGTLFNRFNKVKTLDSFILPYINIEDIKRLIPSTVKVTVDESFIKLKPINYLVRAFICDEINKILLNSCAVAKMTGKTTIDILTIKNNKLEVLKEYKDGYFIFFGDEVDSGNDSDIAKSCDEVFKCNDILDTNRRLKELCCMD